MFQQYKKASSFQLSLSLDTDLLAFFWKIKLCSATLFHSIHLLLLGLHDTSGMMNAPRLTPWLVNRHISDSLSLLLTVPLHHSVYGCVWKHTLNPLVHALSDAQSMNQRPRFHGRHLMRPHMMHQIEGGSHSDVDQPCGGLFMRLKNTPFKVRWAKVSKKIWTLLKYSCGTELRDHRKITSFCDCYLWVCVCVKLKFLFKSINNISSKFQNKNIVI